VRAVTSRVSNVIELASVDDHVGGGPISARDKGQIEVDRVVLCRKHRRDQCGDLLRNRTIRLAAKDLGHLGAVSGCYTGCSIHPLASQFPVQIRLKFLKQRMFI
jgi:hypothetical protein